MVSQARWIVLFDFNTRFYEEIPIISYRKTVRPSEKLKRSPSDGDMTILFSPRTLELRLRPWGKRRVAMILFAALLKAIVWGRG
jgi:hypothetical protein